MIDANKGSPRSWLTTRGWIFLGLFALLVALTGGASRYDAIQVIPLRTLSALFLLPALYYLSFRKLKREVFLVSILVLFVSLTAFQLVPLPPSIWHSLPTRDLLLEMDLVLGLEKIWRPLTLSPIRTWNALGSLIVPVAGLMLAISFGATSRALLHLVSALGILNAVLGLLQVVGGRSSPFYFYEITNRGGAVGIFANENHAGIFAACIMLIITELALRARFDPPVAWLRLLYPSAFFLVLLTALVGGSRAGFASVLGALLVCFCMLILSPSVKKRRSGAGPIRHWTETHPRIFLLLPTMAVFLTLGAFLFLDRSPAVGDMLANDGFSDLRWSIWPITLDMLKVHWLAGTGIGSFENLYKIYEPSELLMPAYVNQAHNDWAQFIIEGGAIALMLLGAVMVWVVRACSSFIMSASTRALGIFWISVFTLIGFASLVDYPLRTPAFQLVGVWLLLSLSSDLRGRRATG